MIAQLVHRIRLLWWAFLSIGLSIATLLIFIFLMLGLGLAVLWIGVPILVSGMWLAGKLANHRRRYVGTLLGRELPSPYLRRPTGTPLARLAQYAADPAVRRDAVWVLADGTVGLALSIIGLVEGIIDLVFWWLPPGLAVRAHAWIDYRLLRTSEKSRLAQRVEQLTESRTQTVDTQAAELRRIERDLHDGAQARLVALGLNLAMAEDLLQRDPEAARELLAEARESSSTALAELRDLVRGIHPPVLADRGLVGAVQALALAAPIAVDVHADLPGSFAAPVESAAYFAVAEALTNVVKHSRASKAEIDLGFADAALQLTVTDDGVGGADASHGTGLRGIERRLATFDGTVAVESPPGGPTRVAMVLPCASSSPKISPSSATD